MEISIAPSITPFGHAKTCVIAKNHTKIPTSVPGSDFRPQFAGKNLKYDRMKSAHELGEIGKAKLFAFRKEGALMVGEVMSKLIVEGMRILVVGPKGVLVLPMIYHFIARI